MTIVIIHGIGGHAGIHWQQWLADQLTAMGHDVHLPEMPDSDHPNRNVWLDTLCDTLQGIDLSKTILIGHSLGTATTLDFVEQLQLPDSSGKLFGLVSVAGMAEAYGAELNDYFLKEKTIDFNQIVTKVSHALVVYGDNDPYVTPEALRQVADGLGVEPILIAQGGHLNSEVGYAEFNALLELLKARLLP